MIIAFSIILVLIISWIAISIYGIFMPFLWNIWQIQNYNIAYYGAISSIERALLVARVQKFGYSWSWWWDQDINIGETISDHNPWNMWLLSDQSNGMRWDMQWKTMRIPKENKWNIPKLFRTDKNIDYNAAYYNTTIIVQPTIKSTWNINNYLEAWIKKNTWDIIKTNRKLPDAIWWNICISCKDEIMILRQRKWKYEDKDFIILPHTDIIEGDINIVWNDTHIRKSIINDSLLYQEPIIWFGDTFNPLTNKPTLSIWEQNGIGEWFADIKTKTFKNLRQTTEDLVLTYDIIQKAEKEDWFIYPFLEYYIESDSEISDNNWHIVWNWRIEPYHIQIQIEKPQKWINRWWSFSVIF